MEKLAGLAENSCSLSSRISLYPQTEFQSNMLCHGIAILFVRRGASVWHCGTAQQGRVPQILHSFLPRGQDLTLSQSTL